jgi:hypothetical protein
MRRPALPRRLCLAWALLLAGVLSACGAGGAPPAVTVVPSPLPATGGAVRRLAVAEVAAGLRAGRLVLLDVRAQQDYDLRHIPGARAFPLFTAAAHLSELPRDRPLVAYCA